jgi:cell wall-associated NlpC family hydrolase
MTVVTVCSGTVVAVSRPAVADSLSSAKAKAAAIESQLTAAQNQMSALSQQYDAAQYRLQQINDKISATKSAITADRKQVTGDRVTLSKAAVANYVSDGSATSSNSIFSSGNEKTLGAASEYNTIAEGDINAAVDTLHTAEGTLNTQESQLQGQQAQADNALSAEQNAIAQNEQVEQQQKNALAQENGQIASLVQAAELRAVKASQAVTVSRISTSVNRATFAGLSNAAPPPTASGGEGAVQAAESQIGVPYVWAAESPKGSADPGFDCSGLTAWSWGRVGVGLPHYSGGQMSDSTPVPLSDLQPGDLLFYGPGGSEHVAMYVGPGTMIEAPETGESVHLTALRLGGDFVGAGRP